MGEAAVAMTATRTPVREKQPQRIDASLPQECGMEIIMKQPSSSSLKVEQPPPEQPPFSSISGDAASDDDEESEAISTSLEKALQQQGSPRSIRSSTSLEKALQLQHGSSTKTNSRRAMSSLQKALQAAQRKKRSQRQPRPLASPLRGATSSTTFPTAGGNVGTPSPQAHRSPSGKSQPPPLTIQQMAYAVLQRRRGTQRQSPKQPPPQTQQQLQPLQQQQPSQPPTAALATNAPRRRRTARRAQDTVVDPTMRTNKHVLKEAVLQENLPRNMENVPPHAKQKQGQTTRTADLIAEHEPDHVLPTPEELSKTPAVLAPSHTNRSANLADLSIEHEPDTLLLPTKRGPRFSRSRSSSANMSILPACETTAKVPTDVPPPHPLRKSNHGRSSPTHSHSSRSLRQNNSRSSPTHSHGSSSRSLRQNKSRSSPTHSHGSRSSRSRRHRRGRNPPGHGLPRSRAELVVDDDVPFDEQEGIGGRYEAAPPVRLEYRSKASVSLRPFDESDEEEEQEEVRPLRRRSSLRRRGSRRHSRRRRSQDVLPMVAMEDPEEEDNNHKDDVTSERSGTTHTSDSTCSLSTASSAYVDNGNVPDGVRCSEEDQLGASAADWLYRADPTAACLNLCS